MTHDAWTDWLESFAKKYGHEIKFNKDHFTILPSDILRKAYFEIFLKGEPYNPTVVMTGIGNLRIPVTFDSLKTRIGDDAADELLKMIGYVQSLGPNVLP